MWIQCKIIFKLSQYINQKLLCYSIQKRTDNGQTMIVYNDIPDKTSNYHSVISTLLRIRFFEINYRKFESLALSWS